MHAASNGTHIPLMHTKPASSIVHNHNISPISIPSHDTDEHVEYIYNDLHPHSKDYCNTRQRRYILAERRLTESFARCTSEPTTHQLQIRALERANELLKALAHDSSFRAKKLRQKSAVIEARQAEFCAARLAQGSDQVKRVLLRVQQGEEPGSSLVEENGHRMTRRDANLARFLASSSARTCRRRTVAYRAPKRMSKADVKPFRLTAIHSTNSLTRLLPSLSHPSTTVPTPISTQQPTQTPPTHTTTPADTGGQAMMKRSLVPPPPIDVSRPLTPVAEDNELGSPASSSEGSSTLATPTASTVVAAFPTLPAHPPESSSVGSVTIYQPRVRTRSQLWKDVQPQMPDYAADLLRNFNEAPEDLKLVTFEVRSRWSESHARSSMQTVSAEDHVRHSNVVDVEDVQELSTSLTALPEQEEEQDSMSSLPQSDAPPQTEPVIPMPVPPRPSLDPAWSILSIPNTIPPSPPPPPSPRRLSRFLDSSRTSRMSFVLPGAPKRTLTTKTISSSTSTSTATATPRKRMLSSVTIRHKLSMVLEHPLSLSTVDENSSNSSLSASPGLKENVDARARVATGNARKAKHRFSFIRESSF